MPKATVFYARPGFSYGQLDEQAQEEYSRSGEFFFAKCWLSKKTNDDGIVRVPARAARHVVIGRKGDLYGSGATRSGEKALELTLSPRRSLWVQVVDAHEQPVRGIRVVCQRAAADVGMFSVPTAFIAPTRWSLGATDDNGLVTHVIHTPDSGVRERWSVSASLPGGEHGATDVDPESPPGSPVRIVLPSTGTVTVKILDSSGGRLPPIAVQGFYVEIMTRERAAENRLDWFGQGKRHLVGLDAKGQAVFRRVILGKNMSIKAWPFADLVTFEGPRKGREDVAVEHRLHVDHPFVEGRLIGTDRRPMSNVQFTLLCWTKTEVLSYMSGRADTEGRFVVYLSTSATNKGSANLSVKEGVLNVKNPYADLKRHASYSVRLTGRISLGDVVVPR